MGRGDRCHADNISSVLHLGITLRGQRDLVYYTAAPAGSTEEVQTRHLLPQRPGSVYFSSPVVTESAGACSYYSVSTGMQTGASSGSTFFDPRVKKILIHPVYCQNVYSTLYIASHRIAI